MSPSQYLDENRPVDQMTWAPGEPMVIADRLVDGGGWITRPGCSTFNLYRPPNLKRGNPAAAERWVNHIKRVFPDDADHLIRWLAHRVQRPGEKINHALVLMGKQGIGKDTILEPVKSAVGPWNFIEASPMQLLGRFNGFVKSVILRVSEARDLGELDRYAFYHHLKSYIAAPPDVLRCDEKNLREHSVLNVCGIVITSNDKDGIYLPSDDRRHYVAWSPLSKEDFESGYWPSIYDWYKSGGLEQTAAYLHSVDLAGFDPKAPPAKTRAFYDIVDLNRAPEDAEMADALDTLGKPQVVTLSNIITYAKSESFCAWLQDRRYRRQIPYRMEAAGYVPVRNSGAEDGLWKVQGKRQAIYALRELSTREQLTLASGLAKGPGR